MIPSKVTYAIILYFDNDVFKGNYAIILYFDNDVFKGNVCNNLIF